MFYKKNEKKNILSFFKKLVIRFWKTKKRAKETTSFWLDLKNKLLKKTK